MTNRIHQRVRANLLFCVVVAFVSLSFLGEQVLADLSEKELRRILRERGIAIDSNAIQNAVIEAIVKSVDPRGSIVAADQAAASSAALSVERAEEWPEDICYIKVSGLHSGAGTQIEARLREWDAAGKSGAIIDLRGAGGGDYESVDVLASVFARIDTLLYEVRDTAGKSAGRHLARAVEPMRNYIPLMVLVNGETRDASELLAAVMNERSGVMLLGSRTGGDAGVREPIPLPDGRVLLIAGKKAVPGSGQTYDGAGVVPDIVVASGNTAPGNQVVPDADAVGPEATEDWRERPLSDKAKLDRGLMLKAGSDPVLLRAVDILLGLKVIRLHGNQDNNSIAGGNWR